MHWLHITINIDECAMCVTVQTDRDSLASVLGPWVSPVVLPLDTPRIYPAIQMGIWCLKEQTLEREIRAMHTDTLFEFISVKDKYY